MCGILKAGVWFFSAIIWSRSDNGPGWDGQWTSPACNKASIIISSVAKCLALVMTEWSKRVE